MLGQVRSILQNRRQAGTLLAEKLFSFQGRDAVVVAVPQGGVQVGLEIARLLNLPFEMVFSKRLRHPAHSDLSIGAVGLDGVVLRDDLSNIPSDYVSHQVTLTLRHLEHLQEHYYAGRTPTSLWNRTVILVDDVIREPEEIIACLAAIQKHAPAQTIVAAPVITPCFPHFFADRRIPFHYLFMEGGRHNKPCTYFPETSEQETDRSLEVYHDLWKNR